jgi:apolipoprotein D and lipocalin family protein
MKLFITSFLFFSFSLFASEIRTVNYVDIHKYMGKWYEIAKYENSFQRKCAATTAEYKLVKNKVKVLNSCVKKSNGKIKKAHGIALIANKVTNAELKVSFVPFFKRWGWFAGDYFIMELGENYEYVVVGHPTRKYLWILSRTAVMDEALYQSLLNKIAEQDYDLTKIVRTPTWDID